MNSRVIENFYRYIRIDSESKNEKEIANCLKEDLLKLGFDVKIDNAHEKTGGNTGNVIGILKGDNSIAPILFAAHMDTVCPGIGINPVCKNGILTSEGNTILGGDDKAGIASIIEGITQIIENNEIHGDIEVVFSISEELGLLGAKNLDFSQISSKRAYVIDSSGEVGGIVTSAPSQSEINIKVIGKTAHAGLEPEKGINAISVLAEAISNMQLSRIDEETTANIGTIAGGTKTNIVAEKATAQIEVRSLSMKKLEKHNNHILKCLDNAIEKLGGTVETTVNILYPGFKLSDEENIVINLKKAMETVGIIGYTRSTGGGSDTNIYNANGIKAVNINNGSKKVHTIDEWIMIEDIELTSIIIRELIKRG